MPVLDVSEAELAKTKNDGRVLIEFFNPSCGLCRKMIPVVEEFAEEHPEIRVLRLTPSRDSQFAKDHALRLTPTWVTFTDGKEIHQLAGATSKDILLKLFDRSFTPPSPRKPKELFTLGLGSLFRFTVAWIPGKQGTLRFDFAFLVCRSCLS